MPSPPSFTDDDVGKRVETAAGDRIGVVEMTEDETAYVDLEEGVTDSTRTVLGRGTDADGVVPIEGDDVRDVTADAIRLEAERSTQDAEVGTDPVIERNETTVHEDEGAERRAVGSKSGDAETADETAGEDDGRAGASVGPDPETLEESGADRHPDSEEHPPQGDRTMTKERGETEDP